MWQLPEPVSMTGIVLLFTTVAISPALPLGINTSMYLFSFIKAAAVSRLVSVRSCIELSGKPFAARAF